ncbi:MAG TPA: hypothetical protein VM901_11900 [Bdellovibrionota bacterium]|nr:hypothetical protein [Bdellovibrionota bacterium]
MYSIRSASFSITKLIQLFITLFALATFSSPLYAKDGDETPDPELQAQAARIVEAVEASRRNLPPLTQLQISRLSRGNVDWQADIGSQMQVEDLLESLSLRNSALEREYENDPEGFQNVLKKKNITTTLEGGTATRIQLELENGQLGDLTIVTLNNSGGELVDFIFADLNKISPESVIFEKFIAHRMKYEAIDVAKTDFGRSLLLIDTDMSSVEHQVAALQNTERTLFFPRGFNLKAWMKATFHKPSFKNIFNKEGRKNTAMQCAGAIVVCGVSSYLNLSTVDWYIPVVLNVIYSSSINYVIDTYLVLNGEGSRIKRFAFNFTATSVSFAVALTAWAHGFDHLAHWEPWAWILGNAFASNMLRGAMDNHNTGQIEVGRYTREQAKWKRQWYYSVYANNIRLLHLIAESFTAKSAGSASGNVAARIVIKTSYLVLAGMADWISLRMAEGLAAKAKVDPNFNQQIDVSAALKRAALLRKRFQERIAAVRNSPGHIISFFSGQRVDDIKHKKVQQLFKSWLNAKTAYLYRLEESNLIPEEELDLYRAAFIEDMVDMSILSVKAHEFATPSATPEQVAHFKKTFAASHRRAIREKIAFRYAWNANTKQTDAIHEYADFVSQTLETMARKLNDPKNEKHLSDEDVAKLVGVANDLVNSFETTAPHLSRSLFDNKLSEAFGINAGKAVEHFNGRVTMWRYLYTHSFRLSTVAQISPKLREEFVTLLRDRNFGDFENWARYERDNRYVSPGATYQQELNEVLSLYRELRRRINFKLTNTVGDKEITERTLGTFRDELIAFTALRDYQAHFTTRWTPGTTSPIPPPENFWSYNQKRASHATPVHTTQFSCRSILRVLGKPLM